MNYYNIVRHQELLKPIRTNLLVASYNWFRQNYIDFVNRGTHFILTRRHRYHATNYNEITDGLAINHDGNVLALPIPKMYEFRDTEAQEIDWQHVEMVEKIDGVRVGLFFDENRNPIFFLGQQSSANKADMTGELAAVQSTLAKLHLPYTPRRSWTFEIVDPAVRRTQQYFPPSYGAYLIGGRCLDSLEELSEDELDEQALKFYAERPNRFDGPARSEDLENALYKFGGGEEGYVVRSRGRNGVRLKARTRNFMQVKWRLNMPTNLDLARAWLGINRADIRIFFPHSMKACQDFEETIRQIAKEAVNTVRQWRLADMPRHQQINMLNEAIPDWFYPVVRPLVDYHYNDLLGRAIQSLWDMTAQQVDETVRHYKAIKS